MSEQDRKKAVRPAASGRTTNQLNGGSGTASSLMEGSLSSQHVFTRGRSSRIDPDTRWVQWTVVGLVGMLGVTSFIVSFRALYDVAAWAGLGDGIQWAVPVFIDGAILTYALSVLVHRGRGEPTWPSWVSLGAFTAMSIAANAAHAVSLPQDHWWKTLIGALIAALAPLGVFAATEQMARLVVLRPQDRANSALETASTKVLAARPEGAATTSTAVAAASEPLPVIEQQRDWPIFNEKPEEADAVVMDPIQEGLEAQQPDAEVVAAAAAKVTKEAPRFESRQDSLECTPRAETPEEDPFAAWVEAQRRAGLPVTGKSAGEFLDVSERTGRNRIKELRAERPELFEGDAA
ncbi:DUF2637 domain-containing protein [Kocuria marina]|uniref:DUF2637 domain-containing protein n=1 Tax=Kocuria marina TaxID=223184 RepID=UPI0022E7B3E9|nr:DUF2637 domain-containing protein [Kocuria marina]